MKFCVVIFCSFYFFFFFKQIRNFPFSFLDFLLLPPYFWVIEVTIVLRLLTRHTGSFSLSLSLSRSFLLSGPALYFSRFLPRSTSEKKKKKTRSRRHCRFQFICLSSSSAKCVYNNIKVFR